MAKIIGNAEDIIPDGEEQGSEELTVPENAVAAVFVVFVPDATDPDQSRIEVLIHSKGSEPHVKSFLGEAMHSAIDKFLLDTDIELARLHGRDDEADGIQEIVNLLDL